MNPRILTEKEEAERVQLRQLCNTHEREFNKHMTPHHRRRWSSITKEQSEEMQQVAPFTNEQRSRLEVLDMIGDPPRRVFAYIKEGENDLTQIVTWMGDVLGSVRWCGPAYAVHGFGGSRGIRRNLSAVLVNGLQYSGTYYQSSGNYCRLTVNKASAGHCKR